MTEDKKITIAEENHGERLDHFLVKALADSSRTKIQKMIKSGQVKVNGEMPTVHRFLKTGDKVEIMEDGDFVKVAPKKEKKTAVSGGRELWKKIRIIDDTPDYIVIEKPSGLLVHPTDKKENDTLIDWAAEKYPAIAKIGDEPGRAGIVHRLDKEVSGLMVIPKTQDAFEHFKRLFKIRNIEKKYSVLVYGEVLRNEGEINFPIARNKNKAGLYGSLPIGSTEGKPAKTIYALDKKFRNYSLLTVQILTGRTHQIRIHMLASGHPIVGDPLYKSRRAKDRAQIGRIFLHASRLAFEDLKGQKKEYESPLPTELKDFLKKLI